MPGFFDVMYEEPVPLGEEYPLFTRISIETTNHCNRRCGFCPIAWRDPQPPIIGMSDALFTSVVDQLVGLNFVGVVQLFLLNEPTLDPRLKDRLAEIRSKLPKVTIYASSNGDKLDAIARSKGMDAMIEEALSYYHAGLTVLGLNVYDPGPEQFDRFTAMVAALEAVGVERTENRYRKHPVKRKFIALTDMRTDIEHHTRGTDLLYIRVKEERKHVVAPQSYCSRTQRHIVILQDGTVPLCCALDPTDVDLEKVGDANTQKLVDIWNCEKFFKYRYFTQQALRVLPGCSTCTHKMAYPHVVRKVTATEEKLAEWKDSVPR